MDVLAVYRPLCGHYTVTGRKDSYWRMGSPKVGTPVDVLAVYRLSATLMAATLRREGRTRVGGWVHLRWVHQWMSSQCIGHSDGRYTATGRKDSCWRMGSPKVGTPVDVLAVYRLSATLMAATLRREGRTRDGGWVHLRWVHQWMSLQCIG